MKLPDEFVAKLIEAQLSGEEHLVIELPNGKETCSCFFTWNQVAAGDEIDDRFEANEEEVIEAYSSQSISKTAQTGSSAASDSPRIPEKLGSCLLKKAGS